MAGFCAFWRISPREYDGITHAERAAMFEHMERVNEQRRKEANRYRSRIRRRR